MTLDIVPTGDAGRSPTVNTTRRAPAPYRYPLAALLITDLRLLLRNFFHLYTIIWPLSTSNPRGELYLSRGNLITLAVHGACLVVGLLGFGLIPLWLQLPGYLWLPCAGAYFVVTWSLGRVLNQSVEGETITSVPPVEEVPGEKWIFINGVMAGRWWVQSGIDEISRRFGRPVDAIHNHTFGVLMDLIQCVIQRDIGLTSGCVKQAYQKIRSHLLTRDPENPNEWKYKKIVIIAHSQGALVTSLVLDMLFADLADEVLSRLEVYTFGNASNHFNNPPNTYFPDKGNPIRFPTIKHIEHFANEFDFVARFGVLAYHPGPSTPPPPASVTRSDTELTDKDDDPVFLEWKMERKARPHLHNAGKNAHSGDAGFYDNQFAGKLFIRPGKGGHQFVMHYLDEMFKNGDDGEEVFVPASMVMQDKPGGGAAKGVTVDAGDKGVVKKTDVEQTSRLWSYRGGKVPHD